MIEKISFPSFFFRRAHEKTMFSGLPEILVDLEKLSLPIQQGRNTMTQQEVEKYQSIEKLREVFEALSGQKFTLDCGHHITFGYHLGNSLVVYNGKSPRIICTECGY